MTASGPEGWRAVDEHLVAALVPEDAVLAATRASSARTTAPGIEVTANQGAFLALLVEIANARRVLEFGTLAGYSTIWLARAVGEYGHVTTLELEEQNAGVALGNLQRAGLDERVEIRVGPAADSAVQLIEEGAEPYDFVFIDADKAGTPLYVGAALQLTHPGSVIVIDNVVRGGAVADDDSTDPSVVGIREAHALIAADLRLRATALQTVGAKGWDGFTVVRREA